MSWWTKNRKKILPAIGLLGLNAIPGVGQAVSAGLGSLTGGLLGTGGAGAAGATIPEAVAASKAVGDAAIATKGGIDAAIAAEGGSEAGLAGLDAISKAKFGAMATPIQYGASVGGNALSTAGKVGSAMAVGNQAAGLLGMNQQPPPPPAPPPNQFQPTPVSNPYGDMPPPGIDPRQWAMMSQEQKRMMMMGRG